MKNTIFKLGLLAVCGFALTGVTTAQDNGSSEPQPDVHQPNVNRPRENRGDLFRQLGLSPEQIQQIRKMNIERRPQTNEAQRRLREANRALDEAIYADQVDDAEFEARLKDFQSAQAEIQRLRFTNELSVRRILTPEQLVRFRELRAGFERERRNMQDRPFRNRDMRPMDRQMFRNGKRVNPAARPVRQQPQKPVQ